MPSPSASQLHHGTSLAGASARVTTVDSHARIAGTHAPQGIRPDRQLGAQAETYANHFIAVHLKEIGGGKTYSQLSAESLANPGNAKLKAQVDTVFKGTTLRGLLLNAYALVLADRADRPVHHHRGVRRGRRLPGLSVLGFLHMRRTPAEADLQVAGV